MVNRMSVALMVLLAMMFLGPVPVGASVAPTIDEPALVLDLDYRAVHVRGRLCHSSAGGTGD